MFTMRDKIYRFDDAFKARARAHQFAFREEVLGDYYEEKNPRVILSPGAVRRGLIFCETYRDLILRKVGKFGTSALFSNMLRSEHIPYNLFVPMEEDPDSAVAVFNEIVGGGVSRIRRVCIEFAGDEDRAMYLDDGTSFDAYVEYESVDGERGGIGIEVKYTEHGYPIGVKEAADIKNVDGLYRKMTVKSGYFVPDLDVQVFLKAHHLRQIWRNQLLGYAMVDRGEIQRFHHVHLYPRDNSHFHQYAIPEYKRLLTRKGEECFVGLTYESLFDMLGRYFTTDRQKEWVDYLYRRYICL